MSKRVVIITPKFPYPSYGACEQDRAAGIEWLIGEGWQVFVITKIYSREYQPEVATISRQLNVPIVAIPYRQRRGSLARARLQ